MNKQAFKMLVALGIFFIASHAYALAITPDSGALNVSRYEGNETSQNLINGIIAGIIESPAVLLYSQDVGIGVPESGILAGSYTTTFFNTPTDPTEATITYDGGIFIGPPAYLLVKDGNNTPAWYFFDLTAIGPWNGTDTLELSGFWPRQGAISHVSLYGTQSIPEPGTMLLLGGGLVGLAGWGRKKFRN